MISWPSKQQRPRLDITREIASNSIEGKKFNSQIQVRLTFVILLFTTAHSLQRYYYMLSRSTHVAALHDNDTRRLQASSSLVVPSAHHTTVDCSSDGANCYSNGICCIFLECTADITPTGQSLGVFGACQLGKAQQESAGSPDESVQGTLSFSTVTQCSE